MNSGVGVAKEYEYLSFSTGILNTGLLKTIFSFFFHFVFSVQYVILFRLIHLFLYASAHSHSAIELFCETTNVLYI